MEKLLKKFYRELSIRKYSPLTRKTYFERLKNYFLAKKENWEIYDEDHIKNFLFALEQKGYSASFLNQNLQVIAGGALTLYPSYQPATQKH